MILAFEDMSAFGRLLQPANCFPASAYEKWCCRKSRYKDRIDPRQIFVDNRSRLRPNRSTEMISVVPLMSAALIEVVLPQIMADSGIVESS